MFAERPNDQKLFKEPITETPLITYAVPSVLINALLVHSGQAFDDCSEPKLSTYAEAVMGALEGTKMHQQLRIDGGAVRPSEPMEEIMDTVMLLHLAFTFGDLP